MKDGTSKPGGGGGWLRRYGSGLNLWRDCVRFMASQVPLEPGLSQLIVITLLLHIYVSQPYDVCNGSDRAKLSHLGL
jgi:hypothetical protein